MNINTVTKSQASQKTNIDPVSKNQANEGIKNKVMLQYHIFLN
jgi:hypothetical protein